MIDMQGCQKVGDADGSGEGAKLLGDNEGSLVTSSGANEGVCVGVDTVGE